MKHIQKQTPPQYFIEYKATPNATYEGLPKEALRKSLIREQKGLCAYCMGRISEEWNPALSKYKTEIEHYQSQELFPESQLDYNNLLGVCNGNAGNPQAHLHCDKSKTGDMVLIINPLSKRCEDLCSYHSDGRIDSNDKDVKVDLEKKLNLNVYHLRQNRKNIIDIARLRMERRYKKRPQHDWSKTDLDSEIRFWESPDNQGYLKEYCQAAIFYLKNKLKRVK